MATAGYEVARIALVQRVSRQLESVRTLKKQRIENYFEDWIRFLGRYELPESHGGRGRPSHALAELRARAPFHEDFSAAFLSGEREREAPHGLAVSWLEGLGAEPSVSEAPCSEPETILPCVWIGKRLKNGRALVLKVTPHRVGEILTTRVGLGQSGETYLVGSDLLTRSPLRFWDDERARARRLDIESVRRALHSETEVISSKDYQNESVLSAFTELRRGPVSWALVTEIDLDEVLSPLDVMLQSTLVCLVVVLFVSLWLASLASRSTARPVESMVQGLYEGQERERKRLSQELHDGIGQELTALSLRLSALDMPEETRAPLKTALDRIVSELRRIAHGLMPGVLSRFGLAAGLRGLCEGASADSGVKFRLETSGLDTLERLPDPVERHLYRISQEAVANVMRHAGASECVIRLSRANASVALEIRDNGRGFEATKSQGKGLGNMRERVEALRGKMDYESLAGQGTWIRVTIPLAAASLATRN
jgi:signal transduction histidine kinase